MSLFEQLQSEMIQAMKQGDKDKVSTLRMVVSAIKYAAIDEKGSMSDEAVIAILQREAKKRRESISEYQKADREALAQKEQKELDIIDQYLPEMMSEDEVRSTVSSVLGSKTFPNFGAAMGAVMSQLKGKADGTLVSKIVKELYKQV